MTPRYFHLLAGLCLLGLASGVTAQNLEVTGTTDADGVYVRQTSLFNGKPYYLAEGSSGGAIYYCDSSTSFEEENFCSTHNPTSGLWVIASQFYSGPSTPSTSLLYWMVVPSSSPDAPHTNYFAGQGQGVSAVVTGTSLPVELVSFEAVTSGRRVHLRWATASETNNAGFAVEMRTGEAFAEQGFVGGNGTTLEAQQYAFDMGDLAPGRYIFRLKQVDFDGAFEYSPEVEVAVEPDGALHLSAPWPNPARGVAQVSVTVQQAQPVVVQLYDMLGRAVSTLYDGSMASGETRVISIERGSLPAGLYLIQLQGAYVQGARQVTLL